jgi:two-component system, response regulator
VCEETKILQILLVEDNEADAKITVRAFDKAKYPSKISIVTNGQEALRYLFGEEMYADHERFPKPDIILLDINLPRYDGFQVLEEIKKKEVCRGIPVVVITSSEKREDIIKSYDKGAASYIPKAVNYEDFVKIVEKFNDYWHEVSRLPCSE